LGCASVLGDSRALVDDVSIPVKTKCFECSKNVGRGAWGLTQRIDVLDTHEPLAACLPCMQVACDRSR
jgi:hypothetical protein